MSFIEQRSVIVGQKTYSKLSQLIEKLQSKEFSPLEDELDAATIVEEHNIPSNVVTMNSLVTFKNLTTNQVATLRLVYPNEHKDSTTVSVLAPIGAALIGLREGEQIHWPLPNGKSAQLKIVSVDQQEV